MICRFAKKHFQNKENGFCVFVYHTEDGTVPAAARDGYYKGADIAFTAVGKYLPDTDSVEVDMQGKWVKREKRTAAAGGKTLRKSFLRRRKESWVIFPPAW